MGYQDAWFHVEMEHPGHDPERVLSILKGLEKIEFNEINQVFSYVVCPFSFCNPYNPYPPILDPSDMAPSSTGF